MTTPNTEPQKLTGNFSVGVWVKQGHKETHTLFSGRAVTDVAAKTVKLFVASAEMETKLITYQRMFKLLALPGVTATVAAAYAKALGANFAVEVVEYWKSKVQENAK